jgi:signal transduction histidine kinase
VESLGERLQPPQCEFTLDVPAGLPAVRADRDALVTVLVNLLDNAWKYTPEPRRIALRASAANGAVRFQVSDSGVGVSRRVQRRIFDRFYQVDRTLSRKAGGCGLGLAIVWFIVEAHGGAVEVASQPGKGSTFTVTLPVSVPQAGAQAEAH